METQHLARLTDLELRDMAAVAHVRRGQLRYKRDRLQEFMDQLEAREYDILEEMTRRIREDCAERGL